MLLAVCFSKEAQGFSGPGIRFHGIPVASHSVYGKANGGGRLRFEVAVVLQKLIRTHHFDADVHFCPLFQLKVTANRNLRTISTRRHNGQTSCYPLPVNLNHQ